MLAKLELIFAQQGEVLNQRIDALQLSPACRPGWLIQETADKGRTQAVAATKGHQHLHPGPDNPRERRRHEVIVEAVEARARLAEENLCVESHQLRS